MRKPFYLSTALIPLLIVSGCSTYKLGNNTYKSRAEAEAVNAAYIRKAIDRIEPLKTPLTTKSARCALMSKDQLKTQGIFYGTGEALDYVASVYHAQYETTCHQIRRRNIFSGFTQVQSDGDHVTPPKGEVVIYLYTPGQGKIGWYYASEKIKLTPLHFDHAAGDEKAQKYFIDSVEALVLSE